MPTDRPPTKPRSIYAAVFLGAALYVFILSFQKLSPILLSFILVLLLTLAINPVILNLRQLIGGRIVPTAIVVFAFLCVMGLTAMAFYAPIQRSTSKFIERMPEYWERIQRPLLKMEQKAVIKEQRLKREVSTEVAREDSSKTNAPLQTPEPPAVANDAAPPSGSMIRSGTSALLGGITGSFKGLASNAASLLLIVVTTFFGVVFTSITPRPIFRMMFGLIPEQHHQKAATITKRIAAFIPRWALATLMGMGIIGFMIFLAMWPLFGLQDALVLGLIALVFEAVPYVGPILASIPAFLLAAGEGGFKPLWVLLAYLVVQALENNLVMPVIVGGQLKLHPVAVIFSMLLCVTAFGVLGVLIAMPVVAIFIILHEELFRPRYLPNVTDGELERIARVTLEEKPVAPSEEKIVKEPANEIDPPKIS